MSDRKEAIQAEMFGSFFLKNEEFALAVTGIQEVVNTPDMLTPMPLAPNYLLGIFNLRGTVIPVIDLNVLLNLPVGEVPFQQKKIAIVEMGDVRVGLLFDRTGEVFRNASQDHAKFDYSDADAARKAISGAIKLEQGKRLVQVLDPESLTRLSGVPQSQAQSKSDGARVENKRRQASRRQCISFVVHKDRFAFGIESIQEIIKVPGISSSALSYGNCLGVFELRGELIPIVDFGALLRYRKVRSASEVMDHERVIVMSLGSDRFGLLIDSVETIVTYFAEDLLAVPTFSDQMKSMVTGCIALSPQENVILLNEKEILSNHEINEITRGHSKLYQAKAHTTVASKKTNRKKSYITFRIQNLFGLSIAEVREIINEPKELLHPPGLSKFVKGVFNLRKKMIVVLDTRALYKIPPSENHGRSQILIFESGGVSYGMTVDSVENIVHLSEDDELRLPEALYKNQAGDFQEDVEFAVEVAVHNKSMALLILNLDPLVRRVTESAPKVA